jgi:hypothetical protein
MKSFLLDIAATGDRSVGIRVIRIINGGIIIRRSTEQQEM